LIQVLQALRDQGNTVIVVEHEEEIIKHADHVIDIGPEAGAFGGEVVFSGEISKLLKQKNSLTADYLTGRKAIFIDRKTTKFKDFIRLSGARKHNLQNVDIEIPLHAFTAVSGVSGSGKSTLIKSVLHPALSQHIQGIASAQQDFTALTGDLKSIVNLEFIDQNPIGKSSRSNPVTYLKAYDDIRAIFTTVPLAKQMQLKPSHFSFNVSGGRCDACEGDGYQTIEMQFMADVELLCEECKGKRFKDEILEVEYKGKNISDVLNMTVAEAIPFFSNEHSVSSKHLIQKLTALAEVGLDYVRLGQSNSTLSGGEAQRIKLASFLVKGPNQPHTVFIFDEPTTGLHFHDVQKLMNTFNALLKQGHTIIAIEHHTDVIRSADWVIDLGPEGGDKGGQLLYCGPKEKFSSADTFTSRSVFK
jgi:excinuclease ABC subunit A